MELYIVAPDRMAAATYVARAGWRVFINLFECVKDLEKSITENQRFGMKYEYDLAQEKPRRGSSVAGNATKKTIFKKELPNVEVHQVEWLCFEPVSTPEPQLMMDVRGWKRLTLEDYNAWLVQWRMMGREFRWVFQDEWLPTLPHSESSPKPSIMGFRGRHEVHPSTATSRRTASGAGSDERSHADRHRKG
jgi:hypothetical protein